jgi:hypothetical protein
MQLFMLMCPVRPLSVVNLVSEFEEGQREFVSSKVLQIEMDLAKLNSESAALRPSDVVGLRADISSVEGNSNSISTRDVVRVLRQSPFVAVRDRFFEGRLIGRTDIWRHFQATDATTGKEVCLSFFYDDCSIDRCQEEALRGVELLAGNNHCAT